MYQCSGSDPYVLGLPEPHPDLLVRGTDPRTRIRTKMSRIPNTAGDCGEPHAGSGTIPLFPLLFIVITVRPRILYQVMLFNTF
jgi:hypothetical protein